MKKLLVFALFSVSLSVLAQEDTTSIDLDVLRAPASPAGNMLDITNEQINRPTDPAGLMTLIQTGFLLT